MAAIPSTLAGSENALNRPVAAPAIEISGLRHRYGAREALRGVSLAIAPGEIFALLGPNGGGKTTLFKILSTLLRPQEGSVAVLGYDLASQGAMVRRRIGVVFQHPGLDAKLTVVENLLHHGHLYGMRGSRLRERVHRLLERFELSGRGADLVETLSGGLARRTELARGLLHAPELLLLDEPSTGLDPGARRDFAKHLRTLRDRDGVTVVLTTHTIEEAERADRVAVLHQGSLVALGRPDDLKRSVGGDVVVVHAENPAELRGRIHQRFGVESRVVEGRLRIERPRGHEFVRDLVESFPDEVRSVTFGRPTLEDVFVHVTGRQFWSDGEDKAL